MADNLTTTTTVSTVPSGTVIATDDAGAGGHVQLVKLAISTDGSATALTADNTDGLLVNLGGNNDVTLATLPDTAAGDLAAINTAVSGTLTVDLGANNDVTIDNSSIVHLEDAVHSTGDAGIMPLAVRNDTLAALAGTDGDYAPLQVNGSGALYVDGSGSTQPVSGTVTANLSATDNAVLDQIEVNTSFGDSVGGGTEAAALRVTIANDSTGVLSIDDNGSTISIDDGGGAITVDGTVTANLGATDNAVLDQIEVNTSYGDNTGGGVESGALRVTIANDSTGLLSVDDNGGSLTVDNTNIDNLHSADFDSGAGTDTTPAIGIAVPASGGAAVITGDVTNGLDVDVTRVSGTVTVDGSGVTQPVSGTVTANLSATDNAVLDQIEVNTSYGDSVGGGTEAAALRVTLANDSTGLISVDDNGGSLTVDNGGTFAVQVDAALPAGANTIGEVSIGAATTAAGDLAKAEDAAHTTGDVGVMALAVRNDGGTALAGTSGDYIPLGTDSSGNLYVNVAAGSASGTEYTEDDAAAANPAGPTLTMVRQDTPATLVSADGDVVAARATNYGAQFVQVLDSSGNFINAFGGSGGTSHADDAAFTIGGASSITPTGYLADETTPDSVDEGDVGVPRMTLSRKPYAVITDATSENNAAVDGSGHLQVDIAADSVGIGGGTQYAVDAALGATPTGTLAIAIRDDALSALTPVEGDAVGLRVDSTGALWVTTDDTITVDGSGVTQPVSGTVTANLSATDNAVLDTIETNTDFGTVTGGGAEATALRVTIANDSTGVLSIDDGGGAITVDGTVTANLSATDNTVLDNIDTNTSNTISTNNSTTSTLGISGVYTGTGDDVSNYAAVTTMIDASHDSATDGMTFQFSTDDTNWDDVYTFTYTAADGARRFQFPVTAQYYRVVYTNGGTGQTHFRVQTILHANNVLTSVHRLVDNVDPDRSAQVYKSAIIAQAAGSGDFIAIQSTASGNLKIALEENDAGNLTTNTVQLGGTAISTGNGTTDAGTQRVTISSDSTGVLSVDDNGGSLTVDGTVTANLSATDNAVLDQIEVNTSYGDSVGGGTEAAALRVTIANDSTGLLSVDDNGGSLTVDNAALSVTGGGTEASALRVTIANDSTGLVSIDDGGSTISIDDGAGSITVDGTVTASNTAGDIAHDAADSGNPVKVGGVAYNFDGTAPGTAVAEADRAEFATDVYGRQFVETAHPNYWHATANASTAQTDATVKAAPGAGLKLYITDVILTTDTAMNIELEHGTTDVIPPSYFAANGGLTTNFRTPIACAANTALTWTSSASGNHSVLVVGYTAA